MALQQPSFLNFSSWIPNVLFNTRTPLLDTQQLDLFDPFDEFDRDLSRSFHWLHKPTFPNELSTFPRVPHKYRVTVDCSGFLPSSIKTVINDSKLMVTAHEETKTEDSDDFTSKQMKKTYPLPPNIIADQMVSFMAGNGQLIVEIPLGKTEQQPISDLFPQIISGEGNQKQVQMKFTVPENINPSKVNISVKGHDLILRAEDQLKRPDSVSRVHFYQRTQLPEGAQLESLRCYRDANNQITITAPITQNIHQIGYRKVPIENWPQQQQPQLDQPQQQPKQQQQQQQHKPLLQPQAQPELSGQKIQQQQARKATG